MPLVRSGFGGSTITSVPASQLGPDQTPRGDNVDPVIPSVAAIRSGYTSLGATGAPVSGTVKGLYVWQRTASIREIVAVVGTQIFEIDAGTWVNRTGVAAPTDNPTRFAVLNNQLIAVNEGMVPQTWDGVAATFSNLVGWTFGNAKLATTHLNRLFLAGHNDSDVRFSAAGDPTNWSTPNGGFVTVGGTDGDRIVAMVAAFGYIYIFKEAEVYILDFRGALDFDVIRLGIGFGAVGPHAVYPYRGGVVFASPFGIHWVNPTDIQDIHPFILKDYQNITNKGTIAVGVDERGRLHVCYDSNGDGLNDRSFVFFPPAQRVHPWTNQPFHVFAQRNDGILLGGAAAPRVYQLNSGATDDGTQITMVWDTPDFPMGGLVSRQTGMNAWLRAKVVGASPQNVDVTQFLDGRSLGSAGTIDIAVPDVTGDDALTRLVPLFSDAGRSLRLRFSYTGTAAVEFWDYAVEGVSASARE